MHTERYHSLKMASGRASDEHLACMHDWLRKAADADHRKKCVATALKYKRSLEKELAYLQKRPSSPRVDRRISLIRDYLDLVAKDLTVLTNH
jgi:hypothetical protein